MGQLILIVGILLSYICSTFVAAFMSTITGVGLGTKFITMIIAYSMFSFTFKVLWSRKEVEGIIGSIGILLISHAVIAFVSSLILLLILDTFESYIILSIIRFVLIIGISYVALKIGAHIIDRHYGIEQERNKLLMKEKDEEEREKVLKEAKLSLFNIGDNVIYEPMNRKMIIKEFTNDWRIVCVSYNNGKEEYEGTYKPEQIKKID